MDVDNHPEIIAKLKADMQCPTPHKADRRRFSPSPCASSCTFNRDQQSPSDIPPKGTSDHWIWRSPPEDAMLGKTQGHARQQIMLLLKKDSCSSNDRRNMNTHTHTHIETLDIARFVAPGLWASTELQDRGHKIAAMQCVIEHWPKEVIQHMLEVDMEEAFALIESKPDDLSKQRAVIGRLLLHRTANSNCEVDPACVRLSEIGL